MTKRILSVSEINRYIKDLFSRDLILNDMWVRGEISNYKLHYSGHMYFTLKDESCTLKCVMFKSACFGLKFKPENGNRVIIRGRISVFERDGQYQLYAEEMQPDGVGALHLAFEQLKKKLQEEGLFSQERKKKIPYFPGCIGVITSTTGSVIRDIIKVTGRRNPGVEIKIFPTAVQGEEAPFQIARAIERVNRLQCADVIILARGGGSLEELWAFNEEQVARSIFASRIPVISAVGHETDYTIADFAADLRAPTPSAAAELAVPDRYMLAERIGVLKSRLRVSLLNNLEMKKALLLRLCESRVFKQPLDRVAQERMKLDMLLRMIAGSVQAKERASRSRLELAAGKLDSLSPLSVLSRGYAIARLAEGKKCIKSVTDVRKGDKMEIIIHDGSIKAVVEE